MYLEYDEFLQMGGEMAEEEFARLEMRAGKCVDRLTHGRLRAEVPVRDCVKMAVWALIAQMQADAEHGGRAVQALTNDGLSVKYAAQDEAARYAQIVREHLADETTAAGVGLMYAGVDA